MKTTDEGASALGTSFSSKYNTIVLPPLPRTTRSIKPMVFQQLTNAASRTRMERDLNLDLTVLDGVTVSADYNDVDMKGDFLLGGFQDGDGNEYEDWHDSLRDTNAKFAAAAVCSFKLEPPGCVVGSDRKPADLWVGPTSHGFALAGTCEFWGDFNIVGATLAT